MTRRISVRGIALNDGKLLCVRLRDYEGKLKVGSDDYWCLPGGGLEDNESLLDGIKREMIEETGVKPIIGRLLYIQQFTYNDTEFLEFFFHITNSADYLSIDLSKTTHGEKELAEINYIDPKAVRILPAFLASEPLEDFAVGDNPVRIMSTL